MLKWNPRADLGDMFSTESDGLVLLRATETLIVPKPYTACNAVAGHTPAYILMEWIDGGNSHTVNQEMLGHQLALLHIKGTSPQDPPAYGLGYDNYIGSTRQYNAWYTDWVAFYQEKRLRPQIALAQRKGYMPTTRQQRLEQLVERLDTWLGGVNRQPALLHGDLWGGNVLASRGGNPAIIDPAVSYGDREAEIAYTELFGGFGERFYQAYHHTYPLEPGYADRRDLYNLYHLLNHLNLFGEMYGRQIDSIAQHYVG
jgi:fructosamine-3-kinase